MHNQSEEKNSESIHIPQSADIVGEGMILSNLAWEHFLEASRAYLVFISSDLHILQISNSLAELLGGLPDQFRGKLYHEIIYSSSQPVSDCPVLSLKGSCTYASSVRDYPVLGKSNFKAFRIRSTSGGPSCSVLIIEPVADDLSKTAALSSSVLRGFVNAMPDPVLICDQEGKIVHYSGGFAAMTGLKDMQLLAGAGFLTCLSHSDIDKAVPGFNSIVLGKHDHFSTECHVRKVGGDTLRAEVAMIPLKTEGDLSVLLTFKDISGQVDIEQSASRNEIRITRFKKAFQGFSSDPLHNLNRLIVLLGEMLGASNCSIFRLKGGVPEHLLSWQSPFLTDFNPERPGSIVWDQMRKSTDPFIHLLKPQLTPYFLDNPELQERYNIKTILGIPLRSGKNDSGFISVVFPFNYHLSSDDREFCSIIASTAALETTRQFFGAQAHVDSQNYRDIFDFFTDSIYVLDDEGVFIDVNSGATKMYGYSREEIIGNTLERLSAPGKNNPEEILRAIRKAFEGDSQELEWWGSRKNGEAFPNNVVFSHGKYFGEDVVIAIGRDITEYKKVEEKLLNSNLELKEINQSKDKFFSILAHDLKNPFGGLLGFIDLLYEDIDELTADQVKEYLQNIRTASYHTYSLLENLLEWSRIQTGKVQFHPSKFDLKEEVDSVLMVLEANAVRKNIRLQNQVAAGVIVEADRNMIHSVIQNLSANAIKFSNTNSVVTITGREADMTAAVSPSETSGSKGRQWYEICITDTGIGIPEDIMPKLFKLDGQFSMAGTANEPGTGLGLILCKEMVEKNGGQIRVESSPGKGSTFAFTLPLTT